MIAIENIVIFILLKGTYKKSQSRYNNYNDATNVALDKMSTYSIKLQDEEPIKLQSEITIIRQRTFTEIKIRYVERYYWDQYRDIAAIRSHSRGHCKGISAR